MTGPLLSIVIPCTRGELLKQCLGTIVTQDLEGIEIVVSANGDREVIKNVVAELNNTAIKYLETPEDLKLFESWEFALDHASGEYFTILGDDDGLLVGCIDMFRSLVHSNNHPDYISPALAYYGHSSMDDAAKNSLRFDMSWDKEGTFIADYILADLFKFKRSVFCQTHFFAKLDLLNVFDKIVGYQYPDHYINALLLVQSQTAVLTKTPMIIHGYAIDSSAYLIVNSKDRAIKWETDDGKQIIKHSPVKAHVFINGWLETLRNLQLDYPSLFNKYKYDFCEFFRIYAQELLEEGAYRDISRHATELMYAVASYQIKDEQINKFFAAMQKMIQLKGWENRDLFNDWISGKTYGFENIGQVSGIAFDLYEKKKALLEQSKTV